VTEADEIVIATKAGKVERVAVKDANDPERGVPVKGRRARGVRVVRLGAMPRPAGFIGPMPADQVSAVAVKPPEDPEVLHRGDASDAANPEVDRALRVALEEGEKAVAVVFRPLHALGQVKPGGRPAIAADEWRATGVHQASRYWCAHCGREHPDPHAVYLCIDQHTSRRGATA
jgi:hypothetical protein